MPKIKLDSFKKFFQGKGALILFFFFAASFLALGLLTINFLNKNLLTPREITEEDLKSNELRVNLRVYRDLINKINSAKEKNIDGLAGLRNPFVH